MFITCCPLILASASPRRREFLTRLGLEFSIVPAAIDESCDPAESPWNFARRMAATKAKAVAETKPAACVLGADTVVALDGRIFGKPKSPEEALAMLTTLQGRTHQVITGFAIVARTRNIDEVGAVTTKVTFGTFAEPILQAYVASGEPMDKAGAYGIQGIGSFLVDSISGSCSNVVGLPVHAVVRALLDRALLRAE
ncbi:MAG: Maf family protein [Desulfobulbus sp.]|uniref:Maf family protein n=1 Tax=Desulfobulbus sp. TaxID=895 RepID=UPI002848518E|nr:Maf family protein [Desulfobulbus sp.]MDR2550207.1 Maf family protein [Desulfobulbus sp.]